MANLVLYYCVCHVFFYFVNLVWALKIFWKVLTYCVLVSGVNKEIIAFFMISWLCQSMSYAFCVWFLTHDIGFINHFEGFLFGSLHQAGVVPSLLYLQKMKAEGLLHGGVNIVYHRTYMPPRHLLQVCIYTYMDKHVCIFLCPISLYLGKRYCLSVALGLIRI